MKGNCVYQGRSIYSSKTDQYLLESIKAMVKLECFSDLHIAFLLKSCKRMIVQVGKFSKDCHVLFLRFEKTPCLRLHSKRTHFIGCVRKQIKFSVRR
jgi:hypothetical protein